MIIESVTLKNFRNYKSDRISFQDGLNVIVGKNATGKTNLLESVYLCAVGRAARTPRDKELILWGEQLSHVKLTVKRRFSTRTVDIYIDQKNKKKIAVDGIPISKIGELMGVLNVVYFSPDEMKLIKDSPDERRRFLDISLSQQSKTYFYTLVKYNKILAQRNKLLKNGAGAAQTLNIWDVQLAAEAAKLYMKRKAFVERLKEYAKRKHTILTAGKEDLSLALESFSDANTEAEAAQELLEKLKLAREKDLTLQYTSQGAHRDDLKISASGIDLRKFGSQGQQRAATLSLKLAEIDTFEEETAERPVVLLDDVLSELDPQRRASLLAALGGVQTLLTCTEFYESVAANKIYIPR